MLKRVDPTHFNDLLRVLLLTCALSSAPARADLPKGQWSDAEASSPPSVVVTPEVEEDDSPAVSGFVPPNRKKNQGRRTNVSRAAQKATEAQKKKNKKAVSALEDEESSPGVSGFTPPNKNATRALRAADESEAPVVTAPAPSKIEVPAPTLAPVATAPITPPVEDSAPTPPPVAAAVTEVAATVEVEAPHAPETAGAPAPESMETPQKAPDVAATPTPLQAEVATTPSESMIEVKPRYNPRVPYYQRIRPQWAFEAAGSLKALGPTPSIPGLNSDGKVRAASMQFDWQPAFIQALGVLGFGPGLTLYPISGGTNVTRNISSVWSVGGQVRYQARFFREQPIVPVAGYTYESLNYRLASGPTGRIAVKGVFFGAMFLLNWIEPSGSAEFYVNYGVTRSYLLAELRTQEGSDSVITASGNSLFFGLRFEF